MFAPGAPVTLRLRPMTEGDRPLYYSISLADNCNTIAREVIPAAAAAEGRITVSAPEEAGEYFFALGTKNRFGIYASDRFYFRVAPVS